MLVLVLVNNYYYYGWVYLVVDVGICVDWVVSLVRVLFMFFWLILFVGYMWLVGIWFFCNLVLILWRWWNGFIIFLMSIYFNC